jgi:hypothetical protein
MDKFIGRCFSGIKLIRKEDIKRKSRMELKFTKEFGKKDQKSIFGNVYNNISENGNVWGDISEIFAKKDQNSNTLLEEGNKMAKNGGNVGNLSEKKNITLPKDEKDDGRRQFSNNIIESGNVGNVGNVNTEHIYGEYPVCCSYTHNIPTLPYITKSDRQIQFWDSEECKEIIPKFSKEEIENWFKSNPQTTFTDYYNKFGNGCIETKNELVFLGKLKQNGEKLDYG